MAKPKSDDPEKRAAKAARRKRRHEHIAKGLQMLPRKPRPSAQMDHATNPKAGRNLRDGEKAMERERYGS